jgi:hypothetical protein
MSEELAQSMNVVHLTRNGDVGLLVSYVYPGSSAEKMNLKNGDILLGLIMPDGGAPMIFNTYDYAVMDEELFPWEELDNVPEMYFSEIPEPWKGVKNPLSRQLSNIGIGSRVKLIAICRGKLTGKEFIIDNAPVYFEIAPAFRSGALGLEVKDMTFEVRRYFRMDNNAPGVIISNVYAGKPASVAGLRPFEIITAVDDKAVYSAGDFKNAIT